MSTSGVSVVKEGDSITERVPEQADIPQYTPERCEINSLTLEKPMKVIYGMKGIATLPYRDGGIIVGHALDATSRHYSLEEWQQMKNAVALIYIGNQPNYKLLLEEVPSSDPRTSLVFDRLKGVFEAEGLIEITEP